MSRHTHIGRPGRPNARLRLEVLEDRLALNGSPVIDLGGVALGANHAKDHILVRYRDADSPVALGGTTLGGEVGLVNNLYKVNLTPGNTVAAALNAYKNDARVAFAEADYELTTSALPNDPLFGQQWALNSTSRDVNAASAWDRSTGSSKVIVALMDTGMDYTHPDLYQNTWLNQGEIPASIRARLTDVNADGVLTFRELNDPRNVGVGKARDLNGNGYVDGGDLRYSIASGGWADGLDNEGDRYVDDLIGWNFYDNNNNPMDVSSHGTHVAGIVGASGNNGVGVAGVDWSVQMMPIKFMGTTGGSVSSFITGLNYAVQHGAKVSNNSWSGAANSQSLISAVAAAANANVVFVAAAGNQSNNNDSVPTYPANLGVDNVISVAATDKTGALASFSNFGANTVDIGAPGVSILSTMPTGTGNDYGLKYGTSMATPFVTGVVALVWAKNPNWTYKQVITQVLNTAEKSAALTGKVKTGGIVNAAAALGVGSVQVASTGAPKVTASGWWGPTTSTRSTVRVTFDRAINVGTLTQADMTILLPNQTTIAPNGVTEVAGSGGKTFDFTFVTQSAAGTYVVKVGPNVYDKNGVRMTTTYQTSFTLSAPAPASVAPAVVASVASGPTLATLSTVRVTFSRSIDLATFTAADATLSGPAGAIAVSGVRAVADSGGRVFDVTFATQSRAGAYVLRLGTGVRDVTGQAVNAFQGTYRIYAPVTYSATTTAAITPGGRGIVMLNVPDDFVIADVNVRLNVTHPRVRDLYVHLQSPNGTDVALMDQMGGSSANLINTVFDDEATTPVVYGSGSFTGSYRPLSPLSAFEGRRSAGSWTIWVEDRGGANRGTVTGFSVLLTRKAG